MVAYERWGRCPRRQDRHPFERMEIGACYPLRVSALAGTPKNYRFGPEYKWRVVTFDCLRRTFRLLILFNEGKQIYRATLAMETRQDLAVFCQYEFHASEPGWHCHVTFREIETLPLGVTRSHLRRWPSANTLPSRREFGIRESNAAGVALTRFRISPVGPLGL